MLRYTLTNQKGLAAWGDRVELCTPSILAAYSEKNVLLNFLSCRHG